MFLENYVNQTTTKHSNETDEEILALSVEKPSVFNELVNKYQTAFLRRARKIVGEDASADAVQDTFVKIYLNVKKFKKVEGASFKSWAYKILTNTCLTYAVKSGKERKVVTNLEPELAENIPDTNSRWYEQLVNKDEVASVLAQMSGIMQETLEDFFLKEKGQQEIAMERGVSVGVVRTRLHRAKKKFEEFL
ncbi:MAG: RNA polymerase sigma factor [Candidatus Paceibacterota bacterium]|jgi:RNA polymerase sigma-70 factor (ECF subfamily)